MKLKKVIVQFISVPSIVLLLMLKAHAGELPRYDVDHHCNRIAEISGSSAMIKNSCMDMEQEAYNNLKPSWASVPIKMQKHCSQVAKVSGGSYSILESCIEMETEEAAQPRQFKF